MTCGWVVQKLQKNDDDDDRWGGPAKTQNKWWRNIRMFPFRIIWILQHICWYTTVRIFVKKLFSSPIETYPVGQNHHFFTLPYIDQFLLFFYIKPFTFGIDCEVKNQGNTEGETNYAMGQTFTCEKFLSKIQN